MPRGRDGPYTAFFNDIAPMMTRVGLVNENQALYPTLMRMLGIEHPPLPRPVAIGVTVAQFGTLLAILALIALKPRDYWRAPAHVFAAALALIAWLLVFSPICWEHYHAYLAPFWGWLIYEGTRSHAKMIVGWLAIALSYLPTSLVFHQIAGGKYRLPEPLFSHLLCAALIMLGMSIWSFARGPARARHLASAGSPSHG
jgi:hypothetical protein